ncbi:Hypothetical predicted protein [Octopus vulgaris]|uniref:Uncharacterized protein n=1 Tax=Octopus vulgaris TaxID=6645 RepID=A0AA36B0Y5_OCTVU|nr:Hypothetical predicted protein [Octopus vulgaris]
MEYVICYNDRNDDRSFNGKFINDIEDSSNINSTSSEIDYEWRLGMTNNANSRNNHNNDVGDDISVYNDYQGGNNSVNCSDNDLFTEELGWLKDFRLEVKFKSDAKSVLHKAQRVPFALRADLAKGYQEAIEKGVW